jgi:hypothetical protein
LLVLETPNVASSDWMKTEVAKARAHRLGLLAVDLPGSTRRRWQRRNLRLAVSRSSITDRGETLLGRRLSGAHGVDYHVTLSARPSSAPAFKRAREATTPPERGLLFGPLTAQMADDVALTAWLDDVSSVRAFDEGMMISTLRAAKVRGL